MSIVAAALIYGIIDGAVVGIAALGFTLQFGVTNYVNLAFGAMLTVSAYTAWVCERGVWHLGFWLGGLIAVLVTTALSFVVGQYVFSPFFRRRPQLLYGLTVTFAASIILDAILLGMFGSYVHNATYPAGALAVHSLGPVDVSNVEVASVGLAVVVFGGLHWLFHYTRLGRSMRAMSDNPQLAYVCGLRTKAIVGSTWALTGCLAGLAGLAIELSVKSFDPTLGDQYLYLIVAAVIFGGIGRPYGALIGALVIGCVSQLAAVTVGEVYSSVSIFVVLVVLMLVRPDGVFGARGRSVFSTA